jgi:hypothetical protein
MKMRFKVLVHQEIFVDESKIHEGIYATPIPDLHGKSMTIAKMIAMRKKILGIEGEEDNGCKNLRKCELVKCDLIMEA